MYMIICARGKGTRTHTRELARTILIQQYCVYNTVGTQYNITAAAAVRSVIIYDNDAGPSEYREWVYIILLLLLLLFVIEYNIRIVYRARDVILIEYYRFPWYALHRRWRRQSPRRFPGRVRFAGVSTVFWCVGVSIYVFLYVKHNIAMLSMSSSSFRDLRRGGDGYSTRKGRLYYNIVLYYYIAPFEEITRRDDNWIMLLYLRQKPKVHGAIRLDPRPL